MNNILFILEVILLYLSIFIFYKKYKKEGFYVWLLLATIISNIMLSKTFEIFTATVNVGIVLNAIIFIIINIYTQKYGSEDMSKIVTNILIGTTISFILITLTSCITSSNINESTNTLFNVVFKNNIRVYLVSMISMLSTLWFNSILYYELRRIKNKIYISNILSSIISQFIESIIFIVGIYLLKVDFNTMLKLVIARYIVKLCICILGTSVIYIINKLKWE